MLRILTLPRAKLRVQRIGLILTEVVAAMIRKRVGILVFPEVEVLDFAGPFEVFSVTRLDESRRREEPSPFEVVIVAETAAPVIATGGLRVVPDHDLSSCPPLDLLVVPGGWGTRTLVQNERVVGWVRDRGGSVALAASVCTGSFVLGQAGLLEGRRATTHWQSLDRMAQTFPEIHVVRDEHVVEDGSIITSAGISAGIDLALQVVARFHGDEIARATARYMEYYYPSPNARRV
jgi:transcriptional regulator GlxA family with amidase domain